MGGRAESVRKGPKTVILYKLRRFLRNRHFYRIKFSSFAFALGLLRPLWPRDENHEESRLGKQPTGRASMIMKYPNKRENPKQSVIVTH